jgi:hypothetical protein
MARASHSSRHTSGWNLMPPFAGPMAEDVLYPVAIEDPGRAVVHNDRDRNGHLSLGVASISIRPSSSPSSSAAP